MTDGSPPTSDHVAHAPQSRHVPVLPAEVERHLAPRAGQTLLDCTAGLGGHSALLATKVLPGGTVILSDLDPGNLARARARVETAAPDVQIVALRGNFADAPRRLAELGLAADMVLADLGFSSSQMDDASRGLSFMRDGPLDMRFDPSGPTTAADLVNTLPQEELAELLRDFGEEPGWRAVAQKLVEERRAGPITSTSRLASIVRSVVGSRGGPSRIDPATRTFQALRIAVNDEMGSLRSLLEAVLRAAAILERSARTDAPASPVWLRPGARIGIISFHSLEDRQVKQTLGELVTRGLGKEVSRRPIEAGPEELAVNPRSRSAKLRVVEITAGTNRVV
jgi:16S rRNA (cytosine1402-N4)-methyltransferase